MSGEQGAKKGKGRGRNRRNRGRGNQPRQSESTPGGLQQHRVEEREEATAPAAAQPTQTPPQQAQAVSSTPQLAQERTPSPQKQVKTKQQTQPQVSQSDGASSQPGAQAQHGPSKRQRGGKKKTAPPASVTREQQPQQASTTSVSEQQTAPTPTKTDTRPTSAAPTEQQPQQATALEPQTPVKASQPSSVPSNQQRGAKKKTTPTKTDTQPTSAPQQATALSPQTAAQQPVQTFLPSQPSSKAEPRPPRRPDGGGKAGRPINLRVNFLPVKLPEEDIHHYDAEIKAKGKKIGEGYTKSEAPQIIQEIVKQYEKANPHGPKLVYDKNGKNIYCRKLIPEIGKDRRVYDVLFTTDNGKEREYTVEVKWVSQVSLYYLNQALEGKLTEIPKDTIQAIDVVLRFLPSMTSIPVGASFFSYPSGQEKDLGYGLQIWNGTFVSIRPTQWKMMLNVDTSSTAFYKAQSVIDFMCDFLDLRNYPNRLDARQSKKFGKEMKTIKIETTHLKRKQKVSGLSRNSSKKELFDCEGTQTSVFDYFKAKYGITLKYPELPCLKLGQKGNCVPIELCNIVQGQRKQGRLSANQTREMIRHTALPAPQRQQEITKVIRNAKFDQDPYCQDFGIKVGQDMVKISGRVLDPPVITFGPKDRPVKETPRDGAWNMQQKAMYQPMELREWALVSFENPQFLNNHGVDNFIQRLCMIGDEKGLRIHPSPCHRTTLRGYEGIGKFFGQLNRDYPNLQLIIAIFPGKGSTDEYYEEMKHYGDVVYGIRTQCIKASNAKKADMQTMANVCLKINAKLGGTTYILDKGIRSPILGRPVIIFGADVTHPSPRDEMSPSIAAVVASMDSHPNLYSAETRIQKHRQEMIEELKDMVKVLLKKFRSRTGATPEKILFYRDGVSEGQFKDVLIHELQAIQRACLELHETFKPAITFIVVQKRHHTRFFAENPRDQRGKSKNIPAGTVVDKQVCHPFEFDWYLCSHAGIQGTSKPAHYHVLYDDSNFKSDDLQILTNQLCHTYVRCSRAVSIPAPAYYAHHVAFRARSHLSEVDRGSSGGSVASGDGGVSLGEEEMIRAVKVHENMNSSMYFA